MTLSDTKEWTSIHARYLHEMTYQCFSMCIKTKEYENMTTKEFNKLQEDVRKFMDNEFRKKARKRLLKIISKKFPGIAIQTWNGNGGGIGDEIKYPRNLRRNN